MVQPVDLSKFPNSSGWRVEHDPNHMTYRIKSEKGHVKEGTYTHRTFAEKGNKAAGGRARKSIGEIKKLVTDYRKASVSESK